MISEEQIALADDCRTHRALVQRAVRWLLKTRRCGVVLAEASGIDGYQPDAIGWGRNGHICIVVECKRSRADFFADFRGRKRKWIHIPQSLIYRFLGTERVYLTPKGMVQPEEVPEGWGLVEVCGKQIRWKKKPPPHVPWKGFGPLEALAAQRGPIGRAIAELDDIARRGFSLPILYSAMRKLTIGRVFRPELGRFDPLPEDER